MQDHKISKYIVGYFEFDLLLKEYYFYNKYILLIIMQVNRMKMNASPPHSLLQQRHLPLGPQLLPLGPQLQPHPRKQTPVI